MRNKILFSVAAINLLASVQILALKTARVQPAKRRLMPWR